MRQPAGRRCRNTDMSLCSVTVKMILREPPMSASPNPLPLRVLTCARCGGVFECGTGGANGGCWCMDHDMRLPMPTTPSDDCLCPSCLRAAPAGSADSAA